MVLYHAISSYQLLEVMLHRRIFHPQEARAAEAFGFAEFVRVETDGLELSKEEQEEGEDFGYWCRQVHRIKV